MGTQQSAQELLPEQEVGIKGKVTLEVLRDTGVVSSGYHQPVISLYDGVAERQLVHPTAGKGWNSIAQSSSTITGSNLLPTSSFNCPS